MSSPVISARSYQCFSPLCDGSVKAIDRVPKPVGRGAVCWCCNSDLYTVPRYGAPDDAVVHHPKVTRAMLGTKAAVVPDGFYAGFGGLMISRPPGATD